MEQFLKDQIKVTLSGTKDLTYTINLYDNAFVRRWAEEFKTILKNKLILEKNYCFLGFADSLRTLDFLCEELNYAVEQINTFNSSEKWHNAGLDPYVIDKKFSAEDFMSLIFSFTSTSSTKSRELGPHIKMFLLKPKFKLVILLCVEEEEEE